jgi:hypothetical protein
MRKLGRTLSGRDARLDKLRPRSASCPRATCRGRVSAAPDYDFAEEMRNWRPGARKVLHQPTG